MLVLTRKAGERILIDKHICITIIRTKRNGVRIGIQAPQDVSVRRDELASGRAKRLLTHSSQ
jgi:carbon storage regulator